MAVTFKTDALKYRESSSDPWQSLSIQATFDAIYPVGSIYMSVNNTNPGTLFGGTWAQIKDTFLLACGDNYNNGDTGGSATHNHTIAHTHTTGSLALQKTHLPNVTLNIYASSNLIYYRNTNATTGSGIAGLGAGTGSVALTTSALGSGTAHNHGNTGDPSSANSGSASSLPPYLAVYVWQRTA